jgi:hypothetical protein
MSWIRNIGQEWEEAAARCGDHFTLVTAFSRDQEEKIYVQHRQGFGSVFNLNQVNGSGSRRAKMTHKKVEKNSCFEVLDVLF